MFARLLCVSRGSTMTLCGLASIQLATKIIQAYKSPWGNHLEDIGSLTTDSVASASQTGVSKSTWQQCAQTIDECVIYL